MRRHELDVTSLLAGLIFVAVAGAYLLGERTGHRVGVGWVLPLALVAVGFAALAGGLSRALGRGDDSDSAATPVNTPNADDIPR